MEQEDYVTELLTKWAQLGHLDRVHDSDRIKVAQRLEAAHRRTLGQRGDPAAVVDELGKLRREGYIEQDGRPDVRLRQVRRMDRRGRDCRDRSSGVARPA